MLSMMAGAVPVTVSVTPDVAVMVAVMTTEAGATDVIAAAATVPTTTTQGVRLRVGRCAGGNVFALVHGDRS